MSHETDARPASLRYLQAVRTTLERLDGQLGAVETAARWVAEVIGDGGLVFVTGTGHSHMIAEEVFYRAGGLVAVCPILEPSLLLDRGAIKSTRMERLHELGCIVIDDSGLTSDDLLVVVSNSGRNPVPVDMALRAKEIGCRVVGIGSREHASRVASRHVSGAALVDVVDLFLDNCAPYGDAAVHVTGSTTRVGPVSTIAGVALINAVMARAAELLGLAGRPPKVFASANLGTEQVVDPDVIREARIRIKAL